MRIARLRQVERAYGCLVEDLARWNMHVTEDLQPGATLSVSDKRARRVSESSHFPSCRVLKSPILLYSIMMTVNGVNGPSSSAKPAVPPGIYVPTVTFFHDDEDQSLDLETLASHARFLIEAGVHGITINGTTGEFPLLTREERNAIVSRIARIRQDLKTVTTLVVGCSAQSTRETVQMCKDTKAAGGDYVLVLPPSYWAKAMGTVEVIASFYREVSIPSTVLELSDREVRWRTSHPYR